MIRPLGQGTGLSQASNYTECNLYCVNLKTWLLKAIKKGCNRISW